MSSYQLGKLAQVIHVTGDLDGADSFYRTVFGGERFYHGYSPAEKRDASLIAVGDFTIEPMAPASSDGADQMPVGRFFARFGDHLHSIALNVSGVPELYEHLRANGVRVVGPGGADPTQMPDDSVKSIYTHPKDTHCLLEFVDFGEEVMPLSPRSGPDWDPARWRDHHPLGIAGASHITVVVRDLAQATRFFSDVLGCEVFQEDAATGRAAASRYLLLGSETVVELAQPVQAGTRAAQDLASNGEIVHAVTLRTIDLDRAIDHLAHSKIPIAERSDDTVVLDPAACYGAVLVLTASPLPNDPRTA